MYKQGAQLLEGSDVYKHSRIGNDLIKEVAKFRTRTEIIS